MTRYLTTPQTRRHVAHLHADSLAGHVAPLHADNLGARGTPAFGYIHIAWEATWHTCLRRAREAKSCSRRARKEAPLQASPPARLCRSFACSYPGSDPVSKVAKNVDFKGFLGTQFPAGEGREPEEEAGGAGERMECNDYICSHVLSDCVIRLLYMRTDEGKICGGRAFPSLRATWLRRTMAACVRLGTGFRVRSRGIFFTYENNPPPQKKRKTTACLVGTSLYMHHMMHHMALSKD